MAAVEATEAVTVGTVAAVGIMAVEDGTTAVGEAMAVAAIGGGDIIITIGIKVLA